MDNFGSEIGQKMRSAVKAKLLELGTGGTTGYIDDELPDYVMIMVANKRSKQQMVSDLNLFLGSQTDLFVTWLHEVLQKLQEVTLPAVTAPKKRKADAKQDAAANKKDRKSGKREHKTSTSKKSADELHNTSGHASDKAATTNAPSVPPISSITDVFADVFLEKAKKNLSTTAEAAAHIKKAKGAGKNASNESATTKSKVTDDNSTADGSTANEQSLNSAGGDKKKSTDAASEADREKDLAELAEIQKKIYAAKKHLRQLGELDDENSDYDEDFINLKADGTDEEGESASPKGSATTERAQKEAKTTKRRSPIIFDAGEKKKQVEDRNTHFTPPPLSSVATKTNNNNDRRHNSAGRSQILPNKQSHEREREHTSDRDRERNRERERMSDRDRERERMSDRDRERNHTTERDRERNHTSERDRDHTGERGRERDRDHGNERERQREHDKQRERDGERDKRDKTEEASKRPVHERLGSRQQTARDVQPQPRRQREDKKLFVPSFRRKENENARENDRERGGGQEKDPNRERERERERIKEKERQRERERERERERARERNPFSGKPRGRSEDRRKEHDLENERERQRERAKEQSRDRLSKRKESEPKLRRSVSPALRRTTSNNEHRAVPNITVSTVVDPHVKKQKINEHESEEGSSSSTDSSSGSEESSDEENDTPPQSPQTQRQRIGSRVIVAPVKPVESSEEEEDKSVNSVIKIKPRTAVSPSKQACKALLLRAVAEAQRSTNVKTRQRKASNIIRDPEDERKLYTKGYRDRLNRGAKATSTSNLFKRATQNLVIKVETLQNRKPNINKEIEADQIAHSDEEAEEYEEDMEESYVPGKVLQRVDSNINYMFVPKMIRIKNEEHKNNESGSSDEADDDGNEVAEGSLDKSAERKTQFVVTLNDEKAALKFMSKNARSESPVQQVSSSSSVPRFKRAEATSTTTTTQRSNQSTRRPTARSNIKSRLAAKVMPTSTVQRVSDRESSNSLSATPPLRSSDINEKFRKSKEVTKIIIQNDTDEDEEMSPKKLSSTIVVGGSDNSQQRKQNKRTHSEDRSTTPPPARKSDTSLEGKSTPKRKRTLSNSQRDGRSRDADCYVVGDGKTSSTSKKRSRSVDSSHEHERERERVTERGREREREHERDVKRDVSRDYSADRDRQSGEERRKISTRNLEAKKYDNIPSLSSVALDSTAVRVLKTKERCKYHPNCTKQLCDFYHPTSPCKSFPNCKYADKCLYSHPSCKYDLACTNMDCNYAHSGVRDPAQLVPQAPPLSSHVVPVQNYKSISATVATGSTMCKYYPTCTKTGCTFYHPKPCRYGKNCINKLECQFYHHEVQSSNKFKWVASVV